MMKRVFWACWTLAWAMGLAAVSVSAAAAQEKRFALVIGNEAYSGSIGRLEKTHEDAELVASALKTAGFAVDIQKDLDKDGMDDAIDRLLLNLERNPDSIGFFYFSGHGTSAALTGQGRVNMLIPVRGPDEPEIESRSQLIRGAVRMDALIDALAATGSKAIFVVSDACRDELAFSETKGADKGFGVVPARPGVLIAFATAAGSTAPDDGLFSRALAEEIVAPGKKARHAVIDALSKVTEKRSLRDQPFAAPGFIPDDVCFVSCDAGGGAAPAAAAVVQRPAPEPEPAVPAQEKAFFDAAASPCEYQDFLDAFPDSVLAPLAQRRAADCKAAPSVVAAPTIEEAKPLAAAATQAKGYLQGGAMPRVTPSSDPACFSLSKKACDAGLYGELKQIGRTFWGGDHAQARTQLENRCNQGYVDHCLAIGGLIQLGLAGFERDPSRAAKLYKDACDAGHPDGCAEYGVMLQEGLGVSKNVSEAARYYRQACNAGSGPGCSYLGVAHTAGLGVPMDAMAALDYLNRGCSKEVSISCYFLAGFAMSGGDSFTASGYLRQACAVGSGDPWSKQACQDEITLNSTGFYYPNYQPPGLLQ